MNRRMKKHLGLRDYIVQVTMMMMAVTYIDREREREREREILASMARSKDHGFSKRQRRGANVTIMDLNGASFV